jgi:1-acyl-sn-glycerol-3-phosphate acyltransferase
MNEQRTFQTLSNFQLSHAKHNSESSKLQTLATAAVMLPAIAVFLGHGLLLKLIQRDKKQRLEAMINNVSRYSRFALSVMRIDVSSSGHLRSTDDSVLYVCNHMSYVDMMVLASLVPSVFVTSVDMGEVFFLGQMAEIGGSLFIERRNRDRVEHDIEQIAKTLREGFSVTLFPEGTSSNGEKVLPFKKSLLIAAKMAKKRIQPLTLTYSDKRVCWFGDAHFFEHFIGLMGVRTVKAQVEFHLPLEVREKDCRDTLAKWTYQIISESYDRKMAGAIC